MVEGLGALAVIKSEINMSELSGNSETPAEKSSIGLSSDAPKVVSLHASEQRQIFDPLRFPVQNGEAPGKESDVVKRNPPSSPQKSSSSTSPPSLAFQANLITKLASKLNFTPNPEFVSHTEKYYSSVPLINSRKDKAASNVDLTTQTNLINNSTLTAQKNTTSQSSLKFHSNLKSQTSLSSQKNLVSQVNKSSHPINTSIQHRSSTGNLSSTNTVIPVNSYEDMISQTSCSFLCQDPISFPSNTSHSEPSGFTDSGVSGNDKESSNVDKCRNLKLSDLEYCLPASEIYEPETVDFPSSPTTFRNLDASLGEVVRLAEGEAELAKEEQQEEDDDKSVYTAIANPPTGKVILRKVERPKHLDMTHRKRLTVTEELLNVCVDDDQQSISSLSYHNSEDDDDDDAQMLSHDEFTDMLTPDDIDTPDELEESIMERLGPPQPSYETQPEPSAERDPRDEKTWRAVILSGIERRIDMKVIEPYKKVLSHGGYMPGGNNDAIIVFSACFLPDRSRRDYDYVMDHLFMYVLTTLDTLIGEDYVLVYLHGATTRRNMPSFAWLTRCYQMIDRRLRKNLQGLYLVHPSFWVKTVVVMARPFVSSKFARKLRFISNLKELSSLIPLDQVCIPTRVKQYDVIRESLLQKKS